MAEPAGPRVTQLRGTSDQLLLAIQTVALLEQQKRGLSFGDDRFPDMATAVREAAQAVLDFSVAEEAEAARIHETASVDADASDHDRHDAAGDVAGRDPGRVASGRASSPRGTRRQPGGDRAARGVRAPARPLRRHPGRGGPQGQGSGSGHLICPCNAARCGPDGPRKAAARRLRTRRRRTFSNPDERPGPGSDPAREPGPFMSGPRHVPAMRPPGPGGSHLRTGLVHLCHPHRTRRWSWPS